MLISFSLANWLSFRDEATLSMVPTSLRKFNWTLSNFSSEPKRLLPIAVIYGANASGKSNFFKGLSFLKNFIVSGREEGKPTLVTPYRLDPDMAGEPTKFSILIRTDEKVYEYNISMNTKKVVYESLIKYEKNDKSIMLFERKIGEEIEFDKSESDPRNKFVFEGTRDNIAFLTNAFRQKISFVEPVFNWFKNKLTFIDTTSFYPVVDIFNNDSVLQKELSRCLSKYDTGILGVKSEKVKNSKMADIIFNDIEEISLVYSTMGNRTHICKEDGNCRVEVLNAKHFNKLGEEVYFDFKYESDGTKRLLDLLPAILLCKIYPEDEKVFFIDEIDRGLHPHLVYQMITEYLENCSYKNRSQCIMTTHDTDLLDQNILRRDEIWVTDKKEACSYLYSISDYEGIDGNSPIKKLYKYGRFGGIPRLVNRSLPMNKPKDE